MGYEKVYKEALERAKKLKTGFKGYNANVAIIEKIFPELSKSEDERIRKFLVELVSNDKINDYGGLYELRKVSYDDVLTYLEKQKINTEGDFARGYDCGYECCLHSHGAEWLEKQKEQNGMWSEDDERKVEVMYKEGNLKPSEREWLKNLKYRLQKEHKPILEVFGFKVGDAVRLKDGDGRKHIIKSFEEVKGIHGPNFYHVEFEDNSARDGIYPGKKYPNGYYTHMEKFEEEQKPVSGSSEKPNYHAEWSEEDERILKGIIGLIDHDQHYGVSNKEMLAWLKSLYPQLKQEWSEEDKEMIQCCLIALSFFEESGKHEPGAPHSNFFEPNLRRYYPEEVRAWLCSLRPQHHWKPSEEQMEALMLAIEGKCPPTSYMSRRLEDLYEGLVNTFKVESKLDE